MANQRDNPRLPVAVVGANGYIGEVLLELLLGHPRARVAIAASRQHAGKPLDRAIPALRGKTGPLRFTAPDPEALAREEEVELFFLALPHGVAAEYASALLAEGKRVIDVSADFRLFSPELYKTYYGHDHPCPELLAGSPYVLPELSDPAWRDAALIAVPGCYPTSILIPLLPLVREKILSGDGIVINSFSGVSGAGRKVAEDFIFCERAESAKAYGLARHRHLSEIEEQLSFARGGPVTVQFTPHLAPMRRSIITTIVVPAGGRSLEDLYATWKRVYEGRPFVYLLDPGETPDSQDVTGTNRIDMSAVLDERTGNFIITSAEDNLVKGAGGQAVQIMNLWYGFPEDAGL